MNQRITNQKKLDYWLEKHRQEVLGIMSKVCVDTGDSTYYLGASMQDAVSMFASNLKIASGVQEGRAALKVMLDEILLNYGCSVVIHEFN